MLAFSVSEATVIKASAGVVKSVSVLASGDTAGTINDAATVASANAANASLPIPTTPDTRITDRVHLVGIVALPAAGQTLSIEFF